MSENKTKVVKTTTRAYGYNYASLADMAKDGVEIPKMRIKPVVGQDYIEYFDGTEWQLGAKIVVPASNKGMNEAQAYGAALTYARRYTVQMAMSLVCDDDSKLEAQPPKPWNKPNSTGLTNEDIIAMNKRVTAMPRTTDGKVVSTPPEGVSEKQWNYINTMLSHEYKLNYSDVRDVLENKIRPLVKSSADASRIIKEMQVRTPLEEL